MIVAIFEKIICFLLNHVLVGGFRGSIECCWLYHVTFIWKEWSIGVVCLFHLILPGFDALSFFSSSGWVIIYEEVLFANAMCIHFVLMPRFNERWSLDHFVYIWCILKVNTYHFVYIWCIFGILSFRVYNKEK